MKPSGYSYWMGLRYATGGVKGFSRVVNWVTLIGLALGVFLLIFVASIQNGISAELRERIFAVTSHAFLPDSVAQSRLAQLRQHPEVASVEPAFRGVGMIAFGGEAHGLQVLGLSRHDLQGMRTAVVQGNLADLAQGGIALHAQFAADLGIGLNELIVLTLADSQGHAVAPRLQQFQVVATFQFGVHHDYYLILADVDHVRASPIRHAGQLGWRITLADPLAVAALGEQLQGAETWVDVHGEFFFGMQLEKLIFYLLMCFVIALASFNIVSGQAMLINAKRGDIAILTTMGASRRFMIQTFLVQGLVVAGVGILIGLVGGIVASLNAHVLFDLVDDALGIPLLENSVFSRMPAEVSVWDAVVAACVAIGLAVYACLRPVLTALATNPVANLNQAA